MSIVIKHIVPKPIRIKIRKHYPAFLQSAHTMANWLRFIVPDTYDVLTGKRDTLTPPRWMNFVGPGDFKEIGREFFRYFLELGQLQPFEKVLEVGCGLGRMAIPLMSYIDEEIGGSYDGIDIVPQGIKWCKRKITRRAPHFNFQLANIYNCGYNPAGELKSEDYRFPFEDESFDLVFLTSVFTHMLPPGMEHYLSEINRVLKKGGRCLITYFLLNKESRQLMNAGIGAIDFSHKMAGFPYNRIKDPLVPEAAVAYPEAYINKLYKRNHLDQLQSIHYGSWCGRKDFLSFQDLIVAEKSI